MFRLFLGMLLVYGGVSYGIYAYQYIFNDVLISTFNTAGALIFTSFILTLDGIAKIVVELLKK